MIAVTGASGHIGNVVCRKLLEKGYQVKAFYHSDDTSLQGLAVEKVQGDILNPSDVDRLLEGCECVIHCAAMISIDGDKNGRVFQTNTEGPRNVLAASLRKGVKKIIHLSSVHAVTEIPHSEPYDETRPYKQKHDFVYDFSKATGEQIVLNGARNQPVEVVIIRPSCVLGPYDFKPSMIGAGLMDFYHGKIPVLPPGGYDFVDVRDVAESICQAIEHGKNGEVYLLSGKYYDFRELTQIIRDQTRAKVPKMVMPVWLLKFLLPFIALYGKLQKIQPAFTRESLAALLNGHPGMDNSKAVRVLGHSPRPLAESIRDFYNWIADQAQRTEK